MKIMKFSVLVLLVTIMSCKANQGKYNLDKGYMAEGYDVVAYFDNKAIEGNEAFKTTHDNVNYKFSSQENLNIFKKSPEKFVPQYGGYCAWAIADSGKKVSINPKTFEIRDGKLYLFYNSWGNNTLKKWNENDVKGLQKKADLNWEAIKN